VACPATFPTARSDVSDAGARVIPGVAEEAIAATFAAHQRVALVASFQAESGVLIDMAARLGLRPDVLAIDTGRLPAQTLEVMHRFRERYDIRLHVLTPDAGEVEQLVAGHGIDLFRESVELRHSCCRVRKVRPLERALRGYDAWVTGLRRDQSATRATTPMITTDHAHGGIVKAAPLVSWTRADVDDYIERHDVPRHPLYALGYTSIGCDPCTRSTAPGEDERAGRWWWEHEADKECGLHEPAARHIR
jgi:phosphoadenosine phosphosulfate reductase